MRTAVSNARLRSLGVAMVLAFCGPCRSADAPPTAQDLQIAARVLKFQESAGVGTIRVAIVTSEAQPASMAEGRRLAEMLKGGLTVGDLTLTGLLVDQSQLGGASGIGAVFATTGTDPKLIQAATRQHGVPCLTRQVELVSSGACTVAIRTSPGVAIYFNSANAAAAGVSFATAFIMMVHEL